MFTIALSRMSFPMSQRVSTELLLLDAVRLEAGEFRTVYARPSEHGKLEGTGRVTGAVTDRDVVAHDAIKVAEANGLIGIG